MIFSLRRLPSILILGVTPETVGSCSPQARLGTLVHQKNAAVICLTTVNKEDESKLSTLKSNFKAQFNEGFQRKWGGGIMGLKTQRKLEKRQQAIEAELAKKAQY